MENVISVLALLVGACIGTIFTNGWWKDDIQWHASTEQLLKVRKRFYKITWA